MDARDLIARLDMQRHPEGGWFRQTFRDADAVDRRAVSTAIYYLLEKGDRSHWHRVDATEIWHFYAGGPLQLSLSPDGTWREMLVLGNDVTGGERPQIVVPKGHWQSAAPLGAWTLVGCTVAPGFRFEGFEMAPPGWEPGQRA
ncbi:MAG: cupin domain-containing protein [Alphaproteobacteria bacterium]|nr:cupin domain-containing protein [Alphaproteobacteria bacterium]